MLIEPTNAEWRTTLHDTLNALEACVQTEDPVAMLAACKVAERMTAVAVTSQLCASALGCVAHLNHIAAVVYADERMVEHAIRCRLRELSTLMQLYRHISGPGELAETVWSPAQVRIQMAGAHIALARVYRCAGMTEEERLALRDAQTVLDTSIEQVTPGSDRSVLLQASTETIDANCSLANKTGDAVALASLTVAKDAHRWLLWQLEAHGYAEIRH